MAIIDPRSITLRTGEPLTVRSAAEADARALVGLSHDVVRTSDFNVTTEEEVVTDLAERAAWIAQHRAEPGRLALLAEVGAEPVGELDFRSGARRRIAHAGRFGVSVAAAWRGRGVGRALISTMLDWARAHPILEKVCLGVFANNHGAIALYRSLGFVEEGRRIREIKLGDGRYVDDVQMYQFVKPIAPPATEDHP